MEINKVSNPDKVKKNLEKYYGKDVEIYLSTRKGKKYMVVSPDGKKIHFGDVNFADYTKHLDKDRQKSFFNRNHKWKDAKPFTPANLSFYLLWN